MPQNPPLHECKVLVIDDDTIVRRALCAGLAKLGYPTAEAPTAEAGLAEFKKEKPEIVITDVVMPEKNGLQLITEIRALNPKVKIIAMSGGGKANNGEFFDFATELGAAATLAKPFELEDVKAVLEKVRG